MERVCKFLKEAGTYYLATVEGDQPRVRPFGTAHIFEGKLYIQTGKVKEVSKQLHANSKAEICAFKNGEWLRVAGELIEDDRVEARQSMLDAYPSLQKIVWLQEPMASAKSACMRFRSSRISFSVLLIAIQSLPLFIVISRIMNLRLKSNEIPEFLHLCISRLLFQKF